MDINKAFLSFEIAHYDDYTIVVDVIASNGRFAGFTKFYTGANGKELIEFARILQGFPKRVDQVEEFTFGILHSQPIRLRESRVEFSSFESYIDLKFLCIDGFGHTAVDIDLCKEADLIESRGKSIFRNAVLPRPT